MEKERHARTQTAVKHEDISHDPPSEDQTHQPSNATTETPRKQTQLQKYMAREGLRARNVKKALGIMHPEDLEFERAVEDMSSPSESVAPGEYGFKDTSPNPDLGRYQRYFSTPKTTRSMTQSSRGNQTQGEAEEDLNTDGALSMTGSDVPRISAFAKLEFDDGEFYMNTYSVELGRDLSSARQAFQKAEEPTENGGSKRKKRSASSGASSHVPRKLKRKRGRRHPSSVVSENGGVIAVDRSDSESLDGFKPKRAKSTSSSSLQISRKGSMLFAPQATDYQALAMASLMGPSAFSQFAGSSLPIPSPEACPLIPIHPPVSRPLPTEENGQSSSEAPAEDTVGSHKAISRKHVRIAFNFEKHYFQVHILGRNGAYVDDEFCAAGDVRALTNGSLIQIGGVSVRFQLPDVALGDTGAESNTNPDYIPNGRQGLAEDSSMEGSNEVGGDDSEEEAPEEDEGKDEPDKAVRTSRKISRKAPRKANSRRIAPTKGKAGRSGKAESKSMPQTEMAPPIPRRKGPGRPPKNGIMSKREQALLARQAREEAKAAAQRSVDGGSKHPEDKASKASPEDKQEVTSTQPNGKRKYTKRKSKTELLQEQQGTRESTEHTDSVAPEQIAALKPPKEKKPPKLPRSPSPVIDKNSLSEEQLAKPTSSYVVLIYEALTEHAEQGKGPMSLHQIYSSIARKYPYFKFVVTTVGWQSSIRHNLLQHEAFEKIEREGKGWMWGLKAGVSIEKEKRRRLSPPHTQPQYYPPPHLMQYPYAYYPGLPPPPNGHRPYSPYPPPGMPPYMHPGMRPPPGYPPGSHPPPQRPAGHPLPIINAQADTSSTYQSPYAPSRSPAQSRPPSNEPGPNQASAKETSSTEASQLRSSDASPNYAKDAPAAPNSFQPSQPPSNLSSEKQQKLDHFRAAVMQSMPDKTFAEHLLSSAIARSLGQQVHSTLPGHGAGLPEHPQEVLIMQTVRKILDETPKKASAASAPAETSGVVDKDGGDGQHTSDEAVKEPRERVVETEMKEEETAAVEVATAAPTLCSADEKPHDASAKEETKSSEPTTAGAGNVAPAHNAPPQEQEESRDSHESNTTAETET